MDGKLPQGHEEEFQSGDDTEAKARRAAPQPSGSEGPASARGRGKRAAQDSQPGGSGEKKKKKVSQPGSTGVKLGAKKPKK